jgi:hypothetical protein
MKFIKMEINQTYLLWVRVSPSPSFDSSSDTSTIHEEGESVFSKSSQWSSFGWLLGWSVGWSLNDFDSSIMLLKSDLSLIETYWIIFSIISSPVRIRIFIRWKQTQQKNPDRRRNLTKRKTHTRERWNNNYPHSFYIKFIWIMVNNYFVDLVSHS